MGRGDILALVAIVLIISAFAYYAYEQYTFSRAGKAILVEYRASKAWRKGDTWYFQSQSFSAGHVVSHVVFAVFKIEADKVRYIKLLISAQNVNYIRLTTGKDGLGGYIHISPGKHVVEVFFNGTSVTSIKVDGKHIMILGYGHWDSEGYELIVRSSSEQKHTLIIKFLETGF